MKVGFLVYGNMDRIYGVQRYVINLTNELCKNKDFEIEIFITGIMSDEFKNSLDDRICVLALGISSVKSNFFHVAREFRKRRADTWFGVMEFACILMTALKIVSFPRKKIRCIFTIHSPISPRLEKFYKGFKRYNAIAMLRVIGLFATNVICVSRHVLEDVVSLGLFSNTKVCFVYNPIIDTREDLRRQKSMPKQKSSLPSIAVIGRLVKTKNVEEVIRALPLVRSNVILKVVGDGPDMDRLVNLANQLNLENIKFLGWQKNLDKVYRETDVVVVCSSYEGFGNVVVEALACSCQVVFNDCARGPLEILSGSKYGFPYLGGSVESLATQIQAAIDFPHSEFDLINRSREFSRYSSAENYLKILTARM